MSEYKVNSLLAREVLKEIDHILEQLTVKEHSDIYNTELREKTQHLKLGIVYVGLHFAEILNDEARDRRARLEKELDKF